jgi:hypothetical protein
MRRECPVCGLTWTCVCELAGAPARPTTCPKHGALLGEAGCWDCRNADPAQPEHDAEVEALVEQMMPPYIGTIDAASLRNRLRDAVQAGRELGRAEKVEAMRDDAWEAGRKEGARAAYRDAASRARDCSHSCVSDQHCDFLHAAHERLAKELETLAGVPASEEGE